MISNCIIVEGAKRSTICDLHRANTFIIPNELAKALPKWENKTLKEIKGAQKNKKEEEIDDCISFLLDNELAFFTDTPDWFPKINLQWDAPFEISNAIIDIDSTSTFDVFEILAQLERLYCKHLQIRFFKEIKTSEIENIVQYLNDLESILTSVEFVFPISENFSVEKIDDLRYRNPRISALSLYNCIEDKFLAPIDGKRGYVIFSEINITSEKHCGIISPQLFAINMKAFTESINHNSCLNRKISIDTKGNIKNCPSMTESYGNTNETNLYEAINKPGFKKYWYITKDQINVCRDCEFRRICTDCRAYLEDPKDIYSKPLKCGYSPYTNKWEEWSINPLKQKAIEQYGMQKRVKQD